MAIYDISELEKNDSDKSGFSTQQEQLGQQEITPPRSSWRDRFFSSLTARLFFLLLLIADVFWTLYALTLFAVTLLLSLATAGKVAYFLKSCSCRWLSVKRSLICGVSLFITLFSPSFGIMIACTYFLMYDKSGIEEVVPASLQAQFKEFFKTP